jgi:hypothetical protein
MNEFYPFSPALESLGEVDGAKHNCLGDYMSEHQILGQVIEFVLD